MNNICFFTPVSLNSIGGGERILTMVANYLSHYHHIYIVTYNSSESFFQLNSEITLLPLGLRRHSISLIRKVCPLFFFYKFRKIVIKMHFDQIIAFSDVGTIFVYFSLLGINKEKIAWLHNSYFEPQHFIISKLRILALKHFKTVLVLNQMDKNIYEQLLQKSNVKVKLMYNPLTIVPLKRANCSEKRLLSVGRLNKLKGFDLLIESVTPILKKYPDWKLCIFGQDDGEKDKLEALIRSSQMTCQIAIYPPTTNIYEEYMKSSIFVFASHFESFGLVLLESLALGIPVVAYNSPSGIKDIIINGYNGYLIQPSDKKEFEAKLELLIESETIREQFSKNAFKSVDKFLPQSIMKLWNEIVTNDA